jgi:hypothetical protein
LLDDNVTLIITVKKSVHEDSPKISTRIHLKMPTKIHPQRELLMDKRPNLNMPCRVFA